MPHPDIPRFFCPPEVQSYFLFGPRGTGKSRFLDSTYRNKVLIDLLDEASLLKLSTHPERLEPIVRSLPQHGVCIIDEVQKCPALLSKVHQILEDRSFPAVQFVLTGSSARKLRRQGTDLLAGRALVRRMHPFMAAELGSSFNWELSLRYGMLPLVWGSSAKAETLSSYVALYLREEVKIERLVKSLESFTRFLEAISFSHGEILNLSNVARDCGVKRSTCDGHLEILEDLLLGYRLPSFKKQNRKETVDSSKFYFFDVGVYRSLRPSGPLDSPGMIEGAALEGLVEQHLRAWVSYRNLGEEIFFWRTRAGTEVDFVVYGPRTFHAIEVKLTAEVRRAELGGLRSFLEDFPQASATFLYCGDQRETHGKIRCIPVHEFLMDLRPDSNMSSTN